MKRTLREGRIGTPKNGKVRHVDLSLQLGDLLKALHVEREKEPLRKGWGDLPLWVFITWRGTPLDHRHFYARVWQPLLKKAELSAIRVHDLRHTFASLLIQNGESLAYVKDQMGHHSIKLTVDTYGHLVPGGNKAAVDRLDGLETATSRNPDATTSENAVLSVTKRA